MRTFVTVLPLLSVTPLVSGQEKAGEVYTSPLGFRLELPAGWTHREVATEGLRQHVVFHPRGGGGRIQITVRVQAKGAEAGARAARDAVIASLRGRKDYRRVQSISRRLASREAPGLILEATANGTELRARAFYLVENDLLYSIQTVVPIADRDRLAARVEKVSATFRFVALSDKQRIDQLIHTLAARCGSEIDWAPSFAVAAERARKSKKLILVLARMLRNFALTDEDITGPFMDPDVVQLVNERYVAMRLRKGTVVPFADPALYGMSGSTFGTAMLLVTPEGKVVRDGTGPAYPFLLEGLTADPEHPGPPAPRCEDGLDQAEVHLRRGELARAEELLTTPASARGHRLRASLLRCLRRGEPALTELQKARDAEGAASLAVDLTVDEAIVLLRLGRLRDAETRLRRVLEKSDSHPRTAEAKVWHGAVQQVLAGREEATLIWRGLVAAHPDDRWAAKAAGILTSTSFSLGRGERLEWPAENVIAASRHVEREQLAPAEVRRAEREALAWLLAHQRTDGSWIAPMEWKQYRPGTPNPFTQAITAICGRALLPHRDRAEVAKAIEKAIDYIVASHDRARSIQAPRFFMDYSMWSHAYMLWFLADAVGHRVRDGKALARTIALVVNHLKEIQKPDGGWSYYLTTDLSKSGTNQRSMSFTTAAVLLALLRTREVGLEVPAEMITRALECLERTRNENGTYDYFHLADRSRGCRQPGAAGRGPICALALYRGGRGSLDEVRRSLAIFGRHRRELGREVGKALMHAGADGQGSHYLMFDYAHCAAALRALPAEEHATYGGAILEEILRARSVEGSYLDNPLLGRACGTGFALLAFGHLR